MEKQFKNGLTYKRPNLVAYKWEYSDTNDRLLIKYNITLCIRLMSAFVRIILNLV